MSGKQIKLERLVLGVTGVVLSQKARIARSRLSDIERGYVTPAAHEEQRIVDAIESLKHAKQQVSVVAAEVGWPI
jgi:predicted transcriptional regulator